MGKFVDQWHKDLAELEARAKEAGSNMTDVCRKAGISRATPQRWQDNPPQTVMLLDHMDAVINDIRKQKGLPV